MLIDGRIAANRGALIIVKSKTKNCIKIVIVANNDSAKARVLDYGADDFMLNPVSAEVLTNRVITQSDKRL